MSVSLLSLAFSSNRSCFSPRFNTGSALVVLVTLVAACGGQSTTSDNGQLSQNAGASESDDSPADSSGAGETSGGVDEETEDGTEAEMPPTSEAREEPADSDDTSSPADETAGACTDLEEETCVITEGCVAIHSTDGVYRGCGEAGQVCITAIVCGQNSEGDQVEFPSGCMPPGWSPCDSDSEEQPIETQKCESADDCVHCGYTESPPEEPPANGCDCPALCPSTPMHKEQCAALTKLWEPRLCADRDLILCPLAACIAPPTLDCVDGQCVAVEGIPLE